MNFTIMSHELFKNEPKESNSKFKIIVENNIDYLLCPDGKKFALWALLEPVKQQIS